MSKGIFFINTILIICFILFLIPRSHAETIEEEIEYLKDKISVLKIEVESLIDTVLDLITKMNELKNKTSYLNFEISKLRNENLYLETKLGMLENKTNYYRNYFLNSTSNLVDRVGTLAYRIEKIESEIGYITPTPSKTIFGNLKELEYKISELDYKVERLYVSKKLFNDIVIVFLSFFIAFFVALCYVAYKYEKRIKELEDYIKTSIKEK
jgi:chromosome segregation ATPase